MEALQKKAASHLAEALHRMSLNVTINMVACIMFTHSPVWCCIRMRGVAKKRSSKVR